MGVTDEDRERARQCIGNGMYYDEMREAIAQALADERERARAEVLHWLTEDATWGREVLSDDFALGVDHARRRVEEMATGRWLRVIR